jgi:hypothetical protein
MISKQKRVQMSQPKAFYRIESFNGGYVIVRSLGNKVEKITTEDTLPHTLAKLGILIRRELGV